MRLFLAIEIPSPVRRLIGGVQEQLRKSIRAPIRWVDPAKFHFTLKFLGEVDESRKGEIIAAFEGVRAQQFELQLAAVGQLPPEHRANVVMIDIAAIPAAMADLHEKIELAFQPLGFERDLRDFHPHLTLARLSIPRFVSREIAIELPPAKFTVSEFALIQSIPTSDGSSYSTIARNPLT